MCAQYQLVTKTRDKSDTSNITCNKHHAEQSGQFHCYSVPHNHILRDGKFVGGIERSQHQLQIRVPHLEEAETVQDKPLQSSHIDACQKVALALFFFSFPFSSIAFRFRAYFAILCAFHEADREDSGNSAWQQPMRRWRRQQRQQRITPEAETLVASACLAIHLAAPRILRRPRCCVSTVTRRQAHAISHHTVRRRARRARARTRAEPTPVYRRDQPNQHTCLSCAR